MAFVLDAPLAAAWFLPDTHAGAGDTLLDELTMTVAHVPTLFWSEIRSLFLAAERRLRLRSGEAALSMAQLRGLPLRDEGAGNDSLILRLAGRHSLSGSQASYLALALDRSLPLATGDIQLASAARSEGFDVVGPLRGV